MSQVFNPPTILFLVISAFVVGVVAGLMLGKKLLTIACHYVPCKQFHYALGRYVQEHLKAHPYCEIRWLLGDNHETHQQQQQP